MFATVVSKDVPVGFRYFIREIFHPPAIELQRLKIPAGDAFYLVTVPYYRGEIPLEETAEKLRKLKGSVIFDINFPTDENTRCLEFHPERLPFLLLFNTFRDYLPSMKLSPVESSLTVFDSEGLYAKRIEQLVPFFSQIEIFTRNITPYKEEADLLYEKYGLSLILKNRLTGKPPDTTVILCPDEPPFCSFYKGIIFTLSDNPPPCSCLITADGIDLPDEYELLRPSGISRMLFASALYEKGNVKSIGDLSFRKTRIF